MNAKHIMDTSRRQKAVQSVKSGKNVKTLMILTAQNPKGVKMDDEENNKRNASLEKDLSLNHFRWFRIKGKYNDKEKSYIVYNVSIEDAKRISMDYDQESFIFGIHNGEGEITWQYWEKSGNNPYELAVEKNEYVDATDDNNMFSNIGRNFKFRIPFFDHFNQIDTELDAIADCDRLLSESLDDKYTLKHHWLCRAKLYK